MALALNLAVMDFLEVDDNYEDVLDEVKDQSDVDQTDESVDVQIE